MGNSLSEDQTNKQRKNSCSSEEELSEHINLDRTQEQAGFSYKEVQSGWSKKVSGLKNPKEKDSIIDFIILMGIDGVGLVKERLKLSRSKQ